MSMYANETEGNTPERGWVSLGERRKLRLHNTMHGEMVPSESQMTEEDRNDPNDSSNHQHEEKWTNRACSREPSDRSTNPSKHQLPQGFISFNQGTSSPIYHPHRDSVSIAKEKTRESHALNHPHPFHNGKNLGSLYDNFRPSSSNNPSESSQQRGFEKRAFHFMDMGPESGYSVSPGIGQASIASEEHLDGSTTESTIFNTPISAADSSKPPIAPLTSEPTVANPLTLAGQLTGALLSIMRIPNKIKKITKGSAFNMVMEVGDIVKVLGKVTVSDTNGKDHLDYAVENLRSGARVIVAWSTFLPVGVREMCDCRGQRCRCVYVDFEKSRGFFGVGN